MSRRVKLPGADELFRATRATDDAESGPEPSPLSVVKDQAESDSEQRGPSGRVRHDEKITVYLTADELLDLEHTRLTLRRDHGLAIDRGRIVREAIHLALEGVARDGGDSTLVQRLSET
jgi:hypothetical protein